MPDSVYLRRYSISGGILKRSYFSLGISSIVKSQWLVKMAASCVSELPAAESGISRRSVRIELIDMC